MSLKNWFFKQISTSNSSSKKDVVQEVKSPIEIAKTESHDSDLTEIERSVSLVQTLSKELNIDNLTDTRHLSECISDLDRSLVNALLVKLKSLEPAKKAKHDLTLVYQTSQQIEIELVRLSSRYHYWQIQSSMNHIRAQACIENNKYEDYLITSLVSISMSNLSDDPPSESPYFRKHIDNVDDPAEYFIDRIEFYEEALSSLGINQIKEVSKEIFHVMFFGLLEAIGLPFSKLTPDFIYLNYENINHMNFGLPIPHPEQFEMRMRFRYAKPIFPEAAYLWKEYPVILLKHHNSNKSLK